jgi:hypothetical protein
MISSAAKQSNVYPRVNSEMLLWRGRSPQKQNNKSPYQQPKDRIQPKQNVWSFPRTK